MRKQPVYTYIYEGKYPENELQKLKPAKINIFTVGLFQKCDLKSQKNNV
jgi:hypothetical protein